MRFIAVCVLGALLCLSWSPARAEDAAASAADRRAIEQVITSQLEAFRGDAGDAAFGFASPNIRSMFRNAQTFMGMVRRAYPPVYRSRSFRFEGLDTVDDRLVQRVVLVGPDGAEATALYTMERQPDGTWRIDGCALLKPKGLSV